MGFLASRKAVKRLVTFTLLRVEGEFAILQIKDGTVYRYPIAELSDEDLITYLDQCREHLKRMAACPLI